MKNMLKKSLAAVMAVASLATGMVGMSTSAISQTVNFYKDQGAPSSATVTSASWNYITSLYTSTIKVSNFTTTDNSTYIFAGIMVNDDVKSAGNIYPAGGSVSADGLDLGEPAYAYAEVKNLAGTIRAKVAITG